MKVSVSDKPLDKIKADCLAVTLFQGEKPERAVAALDKKIGTAISEVIRLKEFKGKLYEVTSIFTHGKISAVRVLLVGAGKKGDFSPRIARNLAGAAARRAQKIGAKTLAFYLEKPETAEEVIEGAILGVFDPGVYKTKKEETILNELVVVGKVNHEVMNLSSAVSDSVNWVRRLINEPSNIMTPARLVEEAKKLAQDYKFGVEVINEKEAEKKGMGAFVGVAKGSNEPSFMVSLKYKGAKNAPTLGVVGKGVTFDSGGISIKPSKGMWEMKTDMSGAAACLGLMKIVGQFRPKINVIAVLPLTENLPGGSALKPGDVLKAMNGKTIEVLNTDAEGRLVLSDGLVYAQKLGATHLIDIATLTGAINVALGNVAIGVMGKPDSWIQKVIKSGEAAGEVYWQLPTFEEYKELLKSDIADLNNAPGSGQPSAVSGAGSIAGAMFLLEFVSDKTPLAHLDIAATAWLSGDRPYLAKGPTGVGVRTLVKLIESFEKEA